MLTAIARDARYALRTWRKTPGVTGIAVLALALGIGANAAIFTLVKALLLSPLPYPEPARMAVLMRAYKDSNIPTVSALKLDYWRRHARSFEGVTGFDFMGSGFNLAAPGGDPERVLGLRVAGDFFRTIAVSPALGRGFTAEEDRFGGPRVVVLSYGLWQRRFGGDPSAVGRIISLSGFPYQIVGIMPRDFRFQPESELWVPLQAPIKADDMGNFLLCVGRLKPGLTLEQARAEMASIAQAMRREYGKVVADDESVFVAPVTEVLASVLRPALLMLFGAVSFVLLIACANVANLLLARAAARTKEVALRVALGAGRFDLARQMLVESTLLALAGAGLGYIVGSWSVRVLVSFIPVRLPLFDFRPDLRVLAFTIGIALVTGLLFGLAPAIHAWRADINDALKDTGRSSEGRSRGWFRNALVSAETALAVVLVLGAALLIQSIYRINSVQPGFDATNVTTMQMSMVGPRYEDPANVDAFYRRALDRIHALPGVESAAVVTSLPTVRGPDFTIEVAGYQDDGSMPSVQWRSATPRYFEALRIPLLRGRGFSDTDTADSAPVIIVNDAFARRVWPGRNALGEQVRIGRILGFNDPPRTVIGVVAGAREMGLDSATPPVMYVPASQVIPVINTAVNRILPANWVVRSSAPSGVLVEQVKTELRGIDPLQPVSNVRRMEEVVGESLTLRNISTSLLSIFAALALLLAAVGVYGVMAYSVAQRTHEIGIRMALGAGRDAVARMVLRQAAKVTGLGIVLGLLASLALTRALTSLLYGISATNGVTFVFVGALLLAVSLIASYLPAYRAMRVDPMVALRHS